MKFKFESHDEYVSRVTQWARWFAWYPVNVENSQWRWLETVERKKEWIETLIFDEGGPIGTRFMLHDRYRGLQ